MPDVARRSRSTLLVLSCLALIGCKSGGGMPSGTPAVPAPAGVVRMNFAIDPAVTSLDELKPGFPAGAQSFIDHEFLTILLREAGPRYPADPALQAFLADTVSRPGVSGGSLHLCDDRDGRTVHIAAAAGRDAAEIAMVLVDEWRSDLDVDWTPRISKVERLRAAATDVTGRLRRIPGAVLSRSGEAMVLRLPYPGDGAVTRALAAGLVEDFFPADRSHDLAAAATTSTNGP